MKLPLCSKSTKAFGSTSQPVSRVPKQGIDGHPDTKPFSRKQPAVPHDSIAEKQEEGGVGWTVSLLYGINGVSYQTMFQLHSYPQQFGFPLVFSRMLLQGQPKFSQWNPDFDNQDRVSDTPVNTNIAFVYVFSLVL